MQHVLTLRLDIDEQHAHPRTHGHLIERGIVYDGPPHHAGTAAATPRRCPAQCCELRVEAHDCSEQNILR